MTKHDRTSMSENLETPVCLTPAEARELSELAREVPGALREAVGVMRFFFYGDLFEATGSRLTADDTTATWSVCIKAIEAAMNTHAESLERYEILLGRRLREAGHGDD